MKNRLLYLLLFVMSSCLMQCKDDTPQTIPILTTGDATNVTTNSAEITAKLESDGNSEVSESGFVFSDIVPEPTLANDKVKADVVSGSLSGVLKSLLSSKKYYVRAYATNAVGTGFGNVVTFTTGNEAPTVDNVTITGTIEANKEVIASYHYNDGEGDAEGETQFQWFIADNATGANETMIDGATAKSYIINANYEDKFIAVSVKPLASTGSSPGSAIKSTYFGVGDATTVTFTYNQKTVTYGIINSSKTGKRWLDRNLGAPNAASAYDDYANYGDLFQWGRMDDGHQLTTRAATTAQTSGQATTTTQSPTINPGNNLFIITHQDWTSQANTNLWQGADGINNPCPTGWRIPTRDEWAAEGIETLTDGYSKLKLTRGGYRWYGDGTYGNTASYGSYWTSNINPDVTSNIYVYEIHLSYSEENYIDKASGSSCRCIKN